MYTKDKVPGLITHTLNMVAPQDESTTGDGWKIVRSKKTYGNSTGIFPSTLRPKQTLQMKNQFHLEQARLPLPVETVPHVDTHGPILSKTLIKHLYPRGL